MNAPVPDPPGQPADHLDRRRLLRLAGGVGLASVVGACSSWRPDSAAAPASRPGQPPTANPAAAPATAADLPTTPPPRPVTAGATAALMLCRDAWGARPARAGGKAHTITRMTLHHEAVVLGDNRNAPGHLRSDQRYHQDQHGWVDIAYHVGIDRDGNIYQLRTTEIAGDTATDYDTTGHFLVLCEGDFDQEAVPEAQLHAAAVAFAWAAATFHVASGTLAGHRDLAQTSCPGANLYAHLASGDLKRRIDELLAAGGVDLQPFCGSEAAAKVAAIEAGE
ncbi:N-acetylmuramoyl-L-alanine amidase [Mycobacterium bohemicum]|uniref:N-acetylmuramoyl-L-alanine amidase n=1 Tax=Mycobacterium bohemicum TaxID=56425 RepID=UPI000A154DE6|nr:N-acetylmuramoyl-L-alanine amidase [Mycobacterium bohemicum]